MDALGGIRFGPEILGAARNHGLDPRLLAAVAAQETGGPGASSGRNTVGDGGHGRGLFQIDDRTWPFATTAAAMDPARNADAAAAILRDDLDRYGGDVKAALSAYNAGSPTARGTATTWGDGETLGYADSVMRHYAALGGDSAALLASGTANTVSPAAAVAALSPAASSATASGGASAIDAYAAAFPPPMVQVDSQSPFAPPVSWANLMSSTGPAGGKEAADADGLVTNSIDASDGALDDRDDS